MFGDTPHEPLVATEFFVLRGSLRYATVVLYFLGIVNYDDDCVIDAIEESMDNGNVIDLFAGVGGLSLGAIRAGFHLALAVELDPHAMAAHQQNFPRFTHLASDVDELDGNALMQHAKLKEGELDGLVGGPPCQGFSIIGKRDVVDPRNNLFVKFFDLAMQCCPKFFVVENVPGILEEKYDDIRESAFQKVTNDYVLLEPMKLKASDFGAPTSRERVFFIGYRRDELDPLAYADFEAQKVDTPIKVAEALRSLPSTICSQWLTEEDSWRPINPLPDSFFWRKIVGEIPEGVGDEEAIRRYLEEKLVSGCFGTRHSVAVQTRYEALKQGQRDKVSRAQRLKLDGFCPTLRAGTASDRGSYQAVRPIHPTEARVITPREAARLQGFPDWFQFAPSKWHSFRQIGNSVSPLVAEVVFRVISSHLQPRKKINSHEQ